MLNNSLEDLQAAFMRVKNKEPKVDIHSKYLAAFSDLQEDYSIGCRKQDNNKLKDDGKDSKRRAAGEMERKAAFVNIQPRKKTELDSRIVRLSRLTGGKDRHSKVRTAKGLRDRRVRLSGPTAIQLYDLQERLCLEQPSMAVDWLIKAAKSAIDELNVLDAEMASAYAGNFAQLTSSNCSNVEHCVGSPRESATAAAASGLTAFRVDLTSPKAQGTDSHPAISGKAVSVMNLKQSDLGRSSSSISDGSIKGSAELTSNCSMSKPAASRREARIKARERARKKSASAPNPVGPPLAFQQLNSMKPSSTSLFKRSFPYPMSSLESHSSNDDNPCGTHTKMLSGIDSVQQLLGYNNMQSYTEMCIQDSHLLQNTPSYSTVAIQKSLQPVPSTSASSYAVIESSCIDRTSEIVDPTIPFFHPKKILHLGGNGAQGQTNLCYSSTPNMIMKRVEQQQQQQANIHIKHFGSTFVPTLSNDINILTSSLAGRGPLQSNTSSITNMASLSHSQNNAYGEASAKAARDFVALRDYDDSLFQEFHNAQDNVKYGHSQLWAKEREHL